MLKLVNDDQLKCAEVSGIRRVWELISSLPTSEVSKLNLLKGVNVWSCSELMDILLLSSSDLCRWDELALTSNNTWHVHGAILRLRLFEFTLTKEKDGLIILIDILAMAELEIILPGIARGWHTLHNHIKRLSSLNHKKHSFIICTSQVDGPWILSEES